MYNQNYIKIYIIFLCYLFSEMRLPLNIKQEICEKNVYPILLANNSY